VSQRRACRLLLAAAGSVLPSCGEVLPSPEEPVTVTVLTTTGDGAADLAARVLFQDMAGEVVADLEVDAQGHAQAALPPGGTVSAIRITADTPAELTASITSILDVKPGDDLIFGLEANATVTSHGGQTSMQASFTPVAGATSYTFYTPCGFTKATTSPATLSFRDACHGAKFDLLATTLAGSPAAPMFLKVTDVSYQGGGAFSIPSVFGDMGTFAVDVKNVPEAVSSMSVTRASLNENLPVASTTVVVPGDPAAGDVSVAMPYPQGFGTRSEIVVLMSRPDTRVTQRHEAHTASLGTSATVDLGGQQLPWLANLAPAASGATWAMIAPGDPPDGMLTEWSGSWNDGARPVSLSWRIAQAAEMAGMTLPTLPAAYKMIDPGQQAAPVAPSLVTLYMADYDNLAGYDELRRRPETLLTAPIGSMGAFVGMPFQRRIVVESVRAGGP